MQQIWGPGNASNILYTAQKRLIRPAYAQTQGYPYAVTLDPSLRNADGSIKGLAGATVSTSGGSLTYNAGFFTLDNSIVPGTVMIKTAGEQVVPHTGGDGLHTFGLLDQWVGGVFDNIGQQNEVSVWLGVDSVYELLAPAFNGTGLADATAGVPQPLYPGTDGRLGTTNTGADVVAYLMDVPSTSRIVVKLAI